MSYSPEVYEKVRQMIEARRRRAEDEADARAEAFFASCPEAQEASTEMRQSAYSVVRAIGAGQNATELVQRIRTVNLDEMTPMQALNLLYEWKAVAEKLP